MSGMSGMSVMPSVMPSEISFSETGRPLRRVEASEYLLNRYGIQRKPGTLAKMAVLGGGPVFRKAGRIPLYDRADLDQWALSQFGPKQRSTSDVNLKAEKVASSNC